MVKPRRILLWTTLLGSANLAQLAILSAFLGQAQAWELFNSIPLMIAWVTLTVLLIAGFWAFPRLLRKPGLLAMHLGCVLIIVGGMLSSKFGMKLMDAGKDHKRVYQGSMTIHDGERHSDVRDAGKRQFDTLGFEVESERCWIEYYPFERKLSVQVTRTEKTGRWHSVREHVGQHGGPHGTPHDSTHFKEVLKEKEARESETERFKWKLNEWRDLPLTDDVKIRVTRFDIQPPVTEPYLLLPPLKRDDPPRRIPVRFGGQFDMGSSHAGKLVGRMRPGPWIRWVPNPMDISRDILEPHDEPGGSPSVDVEELVFRGSTYVYTERTANALGKDALMTGARYVPEAQTLKATGRQHPGPVILFPLAGHDKPQVVPAQVGKSFDFMPARGRSGGVVANITKLCFIRLKSDPTSPGQREPVEAKASDPGAEPAAEVDLLIHRGTTTAHAPAVTGELGRRGENVTMMYIPADDPDKIKGMERPIITFEVKRGGRRKEGTFTIDKGQPSSPIRLDSLYGSEAEWARAGQPIVFANANDKPPIREYKSHLVIHKDGKEVARKIIELNHPLHYGGYHFYQIGMDHEDQAYTFITVKSDAGWGIALAGMILMMLGTFVHFWFTPIWKAVVKNRSEKDTRAIEPGAEEVHA